MLNCIKASIERSLTLPEQLAAVHAQAQAIREQTRLKSALLEQGTNFQREFVRAHPFGSLIPVHKHIVTYGGHVYVPGSASSIRGVPDPSNFHSHLACAVTRGQLTVGGQRYELQRVGSVKEMLISSEPDAVRSAESVIARTLYYYRNPQVTLDDALTQTDARLRRGGLVNLFNEPFYLTAQRIGGPTCFDSKCDAMFQIDGKTLFFSSESSSAKRAQLLIVPSVFALGYLNPHPVTRQICHVPDPLRGSYEVTFMMSIPAHDVATEQGTYSFGAVTLHAHCDFLFGGMRLRDYPHVSPASPQYRHFFVFADNKICYNGEERFEKIGLVCGRRYGVDARLPYRLARVLECGFTNLTNGYVPGCRPAQHHASLSQYLKATISKQPQEAPNDG